MSRVAYVNGRYVPHSRAMVHCEDRGYQLADGVYEVVGIYKGRPIDLEGHWARLERSIGAIDLPMPMTMKALTKVAMEVVRRNLIRNGLLYVQVTRGVAPRNHAFPPYATPPALVMTARPGLGMAESKARKGVSLVTCPDLRWKGCDIKSISLLPNVLAKEKAHVAGAYEALLVRDDGTISECASSNIWIVDQRGVFVTRPLGHEILPGITRHRLRDLVIESGAVVEERTFSLQDVLGAAEVFVSSTSGFALPVVQVDDTVIGCGQAGARTLDLRDRYLAWLEKMEGPVWGVGA